MQTHWSDTPANDDVAPTRPEAAAGTSESSPDTCVHQVEILLMRIGFCSDAPCASA